ncbi:MAG: insulinase family protein [Bacteroidota bacterium]
MRNITYVFAAILMMVSIANAQVDRSKLPEPATAKEIKIGDYESFTLKNGLKVFVIQNDKLPRVTYRLILDREPILEGEKAGYLGMVGELMRRGTSNRTKDQLNEEIDFIGAELGAGSTFLFASGLSKYREKIFELMVDVLRNPVFPAEELEKVKKQTISGLATQKDDPDAISANVRGILLYGKEHPYGEIITEETVNNLTIDDIKNYHRQYFKPNIAYLAIVGDINKKSAEKMVKKYLKDWESGDVPSPKYPEVTGPEKTYVALVDRSASVQSVVNITHPIDLKTGSNDVIPVRIMNSILGGGGSARLFTNLREDKGYTYGAYSRTNGDELVGSFSASAKVRNEVTDSAVVEFMKELNTIRTEEVTDDELNRAINSAIGQFGRSLENPNTVATFAINSERYKLPDDYYTNYLKRVQQVTKQDVLNMAQKYIRPDKAYITVVGKGSEIAPKLKQFGEVKYYDMQGVEYDPTKEQVPEGVTAQVVIDDYLKAIGGKDKIDQLKTITVEMTASVMGNNLQMTQKKANGKALTVGVMAGNTIIEQKVNGDQVVMKQMGRSAPVDDATKAAMQLESYIVPEAVYGQYGVSLKLLGIENVEGRSAYAIELTYATGNSVTNYYDKESGLKIRSSSKATGPQGEVVMSQEFLDYKEVEGVKFPQTIKIPMGPGVNMTAKVTSTKINEEISEEEFN